MRLVIVGASGTIGHQLYADAQTQGLPVVGTCFRRNSGLLFPFDMTTSRLPAVLSDLSKNDCVYLLSGFTDMNWIFRNPTKSEELNVVATKRLIDDVLSCGAKLIFISTDQVFDGKSGGYRETDKVNPPTVYGAQKAEIERYLQTKQGKWCIVRTGWNVSWRPTDHCPVRNTYLTLLKPGAKMASDNVFNITDVRDTSRALLTLAGSGMQGIYHVVSTPPITRVDMAELVKSSSRFGDSMEFDRVSFDQIEYPEYRPKKSWLSNDKVVQGVGVQFVCPEKVVRDKTRLIDHWVEMGVI